MQKNLTIVERAHRFEKHHLKYLFALRKLQSEYGKQTIDAILFAAYIQQEYGSFNSKDFKKYDADIPAFYDTAHWNILVNEMLCERWAHGKYRLSKKALRIITVFFNEYSEKTLDMLEEFLDSATY